MPFSFFSDLISPTKYGVPDWQDVDAGKIQRDTVTDNAASFEGAKKLATDYNTFMQDQVAAALKKAVPEFDTLQGQMAKNISAKLKGELPPDVVNNALRTANARARAGGFASGVPGSAGFNLGTRDVLRTSLQQEAEGEAAWSPFVSTVASLKRAPMFDFSSVFMSAQDRVNVAMRNQENRWNVANLKNQMEAQPEPWMKAFAGLGDTAATGAGYWAATNLFRNKSPFGGGGGANYYSPVYG